MQIPILQPIMNVETNQYITLHTYVITTASQVTVICNLVLFITILQSQLNTSHQEVTVLSSSTSAIIGIQEQNLQAIYKFNKLSLLLNVRYTISPTSTRQRYLFISYNNQLDALISQNYFWNKFLHVSDSSSVHHQQFFTVHTAIHTGLLTACQQAVSKPV